MNCCSSSLKDGTELLFDVDSGLLSYLIFIFVMNCPYELLKSGSLLVLNGFMQILSFCLALYRMKEYTYMYWNELFWNVVSPNALCCGARNHLKARFTCNATKKWQVQNCRGHRNSHRSERNRSRAPSAGRGSEHPDWLSQGIVQMLFAA